MKHKTKDDAQNQSEMKNEVLLKNQIDKLETFQRTYKSELDVLAATNIKKTKSLLKITKRVY